MAIVMGKKRKCKRKITRKLPEREKWFSDGKNKVLRERNDKAPIHDFRSGTLQNYLLLGGSL